MAEVESTQSLLDIVVKSHVATDDDLRKFRQKLEDAGKSIPDNQEELANLLIEYDVITGWQAEKLLEGKHRGFVLGKHKLLGHLGKGGMSSVYLAEHMLMQRKVAIKVLPQNRVDDKSYLRRFQQEARAAAKLDHPNIVRAFDVDHEGTTHYLVMEYVDGKDLHQFVRDSGPMNYELAADFVMQAARGLQHAHEEGLIHRDIKPANCLVDRKRVVKILDMGLAKFAEPDEPSLTLANEESVLGTADYLAPEQALDSHAADHRSDIYSLGCTLYFLVTGHPPFNKGSIRERLLKHQVETPPSIFQDRPDAPPGIVNICNRMMAKKPDSRYQSARDVAEALEEWLADRGYEGASGGSGMRARRSEEEGSGIGRFGRSFQPPSPSHASSSGTDTLTSSDRDTSPINEHEEIGLAPIEDDAQVGQDTEKSGAGLSGSDIHGRSREEEEHQEVSPSDSTRSLLEEELENQPTSMPVHSSGAHPALSNRSLRPVDKQDQSVPHWLLWTLVGIGVVVAFLLLLAVRS